MTLHSIRRVPSAAMLAFLLGAPVLQAQTTRLSMGDAARLAAKQNGAATLRRPQGI